MEAEREAPRSKEESTPQKGIAASCVGAHKDIARRGETRKSMLIGQRNLLGNRKKRKKDGSGKSQRDGASPLKKTGRSSKDLGRTARCNKPMSKVSPAQRVSRKEKGADGARSTGGDMREHEGKNASQENGFSKSAGKKGNKKRKSKRKKSRRHANFCTMKRYLWDFATGEYSIGE